MEQNNFIERKGKLEDLDRSFDLKFWQAQSPQVRFQAAWELMEHAWKAKGSAYIRTDNISGRFQEDIGC